MKQKILNLTMLLFCMIVGMGSAWGQVYTLDATDEQNQGTNNVYADNCDITVNDIIWNVTGNATMSPWRIGGKNLTNVDRTVYSKTAYSSALNKVTLEIGNASNIVINSIKLLHSTNEDFSNAETISASNLAANKTYEFAPDGGFPENSYFKFVFNVTVTLTSNKFIEFKKVEFYSDGTTPEQPTKYNVNIDSNISGGTISATPTSAAEGTEITLEATPDDGYQLDSWYVLDGDANEIKVTDNKFTMPASDVEVSAKFERESPVDESYLFYESFNDNNGTGGNDGKWGGSIASSDAKFDNIGWVKVSVTGADACIKIGTKSTTGYVTLPSINYSGDCTLTFKAASWSGDKTSIIIKVGEEAIKTFDLLEGAWKDFEVSISGLTNDSHIEISSSKQGTRFFLDEVKIVKVDSQEPQDPDTPTNSITFKATNDGSKYWATFSSTDNIVLPNEVVFDESEGDFAIITAYAITYAYNDMIQLEKVDLHFDGDGEGTGWYLPANYGYLLKSERSVEGEHSYSYTIGDVDTFNGLTEYSEVLPKNMLVPSSVSMTGDKLFYKLTTQGGENLGFYWGAENGAPFTMNNPNLAYLAIPTELAKEIKSFKLDNLSTAIECIFDTLSTDAPIYNLAGQRVSSDAKGILIQNGKKFFNK